MDSCRSLLRSLGNNLSYTTTVSLRIKSKLLFAIHVLLCLGILTYIGIYAIWISEGYQKSCPVVGAVYVKPKGQAYIGQYNTSSFEEMDVSDLVESSAFGIFLTSALTRTEQVRGQCSAVEESQDPQGKEACEEDADCGEPGTPLWNGISTGICNMTSNFCVVDGWCPIEMDEDKQLVIGIQDFTLFFRVNVRFPACGGVEWNNANGTLPSPGWNLFSVEEILALAGADVSLVQPQGADVAVSINFNCNLDLGVEKCSPELPFSAHQLDTRDSSLSRGYNFRKSIAGPDGETRTLVKEYGFRFRIEVSGKGRKFDPLVTLTTIGAGVALLGIASLATDAILLAFHKDRQLYRQLKYPEVQDEGEDNADEPPNAATEETEAGGSNNNNSSINRSGSGFKYNFSYPRLAFLQRKGENQKSNEDAARPLLPMDTYM